jgi:prepilin-type N-terminal cleavage/methylation domain-containing protein
MKRSRLKRAYTLLEVLVVMTLIGVLLGGVAAALGRGAGRGVDLQTAQAALSASVSLARGEAILQQTSTRLLVSSDRSSTVPADRYLRCLQVVREEPPGGNRWLNVAEAVFLPRGVRVVPPVVGRSDVVEGVIWPEGSNAPRSTLTGPLTVPMDVEPFGESYYLEFAPDGGLPSNPAVLVVAGVQLSPGSLPRFDDPSMLRGLRLGASGVVTPLDHAIDF